MLITKNVSEIAILKLANNDEVIVNIISHDDKEYIVENPFLLIMNQQGGMQFSPMLIMGKEGASISIYRTGVVAKTAPSDNMKEGYEKATSKLVLPTKQGIIV